MSGNELAVVSDLIKGPSQFSGDGKYTKACQEWFANNHQSPITLFTPSCTHSLEMAAILANISPGDEVIMPSYTFVSTANAFILRGAKVIFVDVEPETMNMDSRKVANAVTKNTKAIVPVHYAGVSCDMDSINKTAKECGAMVIEDAAQGVCAYYKSKPLGTLGDFGCFSFHETKNIHCGEGGAIVVNSETQRMAAEIVREKGTDRSLFLKGEVDKYTWRSVGSSFLMNELSAAFLINQLEDAEQVKDKRVELWNRYYENLEELETRGCVKLPKVPDYATHNAHIFFTIWKNMEQRNKLAIYLKERGIRPTAHYVPLHTSPFGEKNTEFRGEDTYTSAYSDSLLRLPMYFDLELNQVDEICQHIKDFIK